MVVLVIIQATPLRKGVQHGCLIKDPIVQSDRLMDFPGHGHEQFLFAVHRNVLSGFPTKDYAIIPR
jgi:hypothetical protein